nr:hypothetical protein [Tanacetum cinerariifolium]
MGAVNAALTFMMLWGDNFEFGSGQSSRDLGKNKLRNTFKCVVCFKEFGSRSALVGPIRALYGNVWFALWDFWSGKAVGGHKRVHNNVIYTQEGATSSTSVHRNVHEVAVNVLMNKRAHDNTK